MRIPQRMRDPLVQYPNVAPRDEEPLLLRWSNLKTLRLMVLQSHKACRLAFYSWSQAFCTRKPRGRAAAHYSFREHQNQEVLRATPALLKKRGRQFGDVHLHPRNPPALPEIAFFPGDSDVSREDFPSLAILEAVGNLATAGKEHRI